MLGKNLFKQLKKFDPDLCELLKLSFDRQISSLSLIPTDNAASPLSQYIKGSALGNDNIGYNALEHYSRVEKLAVKRACEIFGAEHAIVRVGNLVAAARVVLQTFARKGDKILSFNLRKSEHCTGDQMQYDFIKFALEPNNFKLNFDKVKYLALKNKPNYPRNIDCKKLREIADSVGAKLWIDLGQNSGLIAAKKIKSPVPYADIATFSASDALHGPQTGIILTKKKYADLLEQKVIDTGHASLKKNVLAALAITFHEIACEEYQNYAQQVLDNARALEKGLQKAGIELICAPTENHLVIAKFPKNVDVQSTVQNLLQANLLVDAEKFMTADDKIFYPVLRLSSLDPTTRGLYEDDMFTVGLTLGEFLKSPQNASSIKAVKMVVKEMVENLPLFAEEWLPEDEIIHEQDSELMLKTMIYGTM